MLHQEVRLFSRLPHDSVQGVCEVLLSLCASC